MVDAYKCKCGNKFDIDRQGERPAKTAECLKCGRKAKWKPQFSTPRPGKAEPLRPTAHEPVGRRPGAVHIDTTEGGSVTGGMIAVYAHDGDGPAVSIDGDNVDVDLYMKAERTAGGLHMTGGNADVHAFATNDVPEPLVTRGKSRVRIKSPRVSGSGEREGS